MLAEWGYTVVGSDIKPRRSNLMKAKVSQIDFLEDSRGHKAMLRKCDMIVFNPPFNQKTEFLARACELGIPFLLELTSRNLHPGSLEHPFTGLQPTK